ncbi:MAG: extracellular solute-binding protein [Deltaproteobacteria bacterium]|nr:extracellular solute-binding protein [Deltaproteobacteria bacterium]
MKLLRLLSGSALALLFLTAWPCVARAALLDEVIAAARKEGVIEFYAPAAVGPQGVKTLAEAFNKKYGLNITANFYPSSSMTADIGKVASLAAAGVPPEWDVMVVHDAAHATLWLRKLHQPFDFGKLGVDPKLIHYDNGTVAFANQIVLPAYNKKNLLPRAVPRRWEDLLDPAWKGGKLGMTTATHHLARLATLWGEEKSTGFVKALAGQQPTLGRQPEIYTRLILGEISIAVTLTDDRTHTAKVTGAPIVHAEGIEPVISPAYHAGVVKGARHPNAGHLFTAFLTTPEAQEIWGKYGGQTSAFVPGTPAYRYVQGKKVLYMTQDQAGMVDRLTREYGKILGFK